MADTFAPETPSSRSLFAIPTPIKTLFNNFPLQTYPAEALPCSNATLSTSTSITTAADAAATTPQLYIFTSPSHSTSAPSPNPTCLKHQSFLLAARIPHQCVSSTNHASPSGALPFLILPPGEAKSRVPLTGGKILEYVKEHRTTEVGDVESEHKVEAYRALLTEAVRPAWLHDLYLLPANTSLLKQTYLPASSATHPSLLISLCSAATSSILQTTRRANVDSRLLHEEALAALSALDTLLGSAAEGEKQDWFFGAQSPSLFDAEVFAYTHLLLDEQGAMAELESGLREGLKGMGNLVAHERRMYERCWGRDA